MLLLRDVRTESIPSLRLFLHLLYTSPQKLKVNKNQKLFCGVSENVIQSQKNNPIPGDNAAAKRQLFMQINIKFEFCKVLPPTMWQVLYSFLEKKSGKRKKINSHPYKCKYM